MSTARARGGHLARQGQGFAAGTGLLARVAAPSFRRVLDAVDRGLEAGTLTGHLPDGTTRVLGGRGPGPHAVVELRSWRALVRLATGGSVGWYRAWAAGEWWSADPVPLFDLFMRNGVTLADAARAKGPWRWGNRAAHWWRRNTPRRARRNIADHYDLGNDFYAAWLDPTMSYSAALSPADDLEAGQRAKIAAMADRLALDWPGRVLEIGCGWGGQAAELTRRGHRVTAISLSDEQLAWARERTAGVDFRHQDYRVVQGAYDAVVSVEMVEAVGQAYWPAFLDVVAARSGAGRARGAAVYRDRRPAVRRLCRQRRLHPSLCLPGRVPALGTPLSRAGGRPGAALDGRASVRRRLCRHVGALAAAVRRRGGRGSAASGIRCGLRGAVALLP